MGAAAARLRGPYLAGATLMLGVALPALGSAYQGIFGGDQGLNVTFVTSLVAPGAFTVTLSIALLTAAVIGGLGSLPGALWGSLLIVIVPTYITDVATSHGLSSSVGSNIPIAVYGGVLIVVMLAFPQGIQGGLRWILTLFTGPSPQAPDGRRPCSRRRPRRRARTAGPGAGPAALITQRSG